jgi:hypothetical protein
MRKILDLFELKQREIEKVLNGRRRESHVLFRARGGR